MALPATPPTAPTPLATPLARMRLFYNLFPYPNRPIFAWPDPRAHALTHAGFSRLLSEGDFTAARAVWNSQRTRQGRLASRTALGAIREALPTQGTLQALDRLQTSFPSPLRIGLVGCGTDEPLLMRLLHPRNPIDALDLSSRSLAIARVKVGLARLVRSLTPGRPALGGETRYLACEAATFLEGARAGSYAHLQCFGVLHHQHDPRRLFHAMARALSPGGTLRAMVYSHHGRRLERRIQGRYETLWERLVATGASSVARLPALARLAFESLRLRAWKLASLAAPASVRLRFRYLGVAGPFLADALLHPSDPGFPLPEVLAAAEGAGFRLAFCEGKIHERGLVAGFGPGAQAGEEDDAASVWAELAAADARGDLVSNVVAVFRKT